MRVSPHDLALHAIRHSSPEKPADASLRDVLKRTRDLAPFDATEASRLVFAHYRWLGWTRNERTLESRLRRARLLDERFRNNPNSFPVAELRAKAVPEWIFGEMDVRDDWLRWLQHWPTLWLRARKGRALELARKLGAARVADQGDALIYEGEADLFRTPEFHAGEFEIQDIGSQAVGWICDPKPGETWWDACAGEGGKLLHLSDLMENKGIIWASDRAEWRLNNLKRRAARARVFNYRTAFWNGGAKLPTKTKFDGVLVDAPCSGIGTWQRNPHARWTTTPQDVQELAEVQKRLLTNVAPAVKSGGKLVYSVCTLTRGETERVANFFSETQPDFERQSLDATKTNSRTLSSAAVMIHKNSQADRMFIAAWRRKI